MAGHNKNKNIKQSFRQTPVSTSNVGNPKCES